MSHRPRAILRLRPDMVADICAWHGESEGSDKKAADEWALVGGYELNHTICPTCQARLTKDLPRPLRPEDAEPKQGGKHTGDEEVTNDPKRVAEFIHGLEEWLKRNS